MLPESKFAMESNVIVPIIESGVCHEIIFLRMSNIPPMRKHKFIHSHPYPPIVPRPFKTFHASRTVNPSLYFIETSAVALVKPSTGAGQDETVSGKEIRTMT